MDWVNPSLSGDRNSFPSRVWCILPTQLDCELAIVICLRVEDMEKLRMDKAFLNYGKYIS